MSLPVRQLLRQGPVLGALGGALVGALWRGVSGGRPEVARETPGPVVHRTVAPPASDLIDEFVRRSGGDPAGWRGVVPPHLFPQWGFPLAAAVLADLPYPLIRVLNAGCAVTVNAPLPRGEPLEVAARLESLDTDDRRAILRTRITTGTAAEPEAHVAEIHAYVPLVRGGKGEKRAPETAPHGARELARWRLSSTAGAEFAMLTGDVNPIHWLSPYARAFGFRNVILHGFATFSRSVEAVVRGRYAGDTSRLAHADSRFTRPLVLPAEVGLYLEGDRIFVADAPGAPAYLVGTIAP
jgi:acyl dehydratase